jgi:hypothetical protein
MDEIGLAFWGLLGAFAYGAPRLIVALSESPRNRWSPWAEFIVALVVGATGSGAFVALAANLMHWGSDVSSQRALAVVIGLVANPAAPSVVRVATSQLLRRIDASAGSPPSAKPRENEST